MTTDDYFQFKKIVFGAFLPFIGSWQQPGEGERYEVHDKVLRGLLAFLFINLFVLFQSQLHRNKWKIQICSFNIN